MLKEKAKNHREIDEKEALLCAKNNMRYTKL
jgi:hypothetical protein